MIVGTSGELSERWAARCRDRVPKSQLPVARASLGHLTSLCFGVNQSSMLVALEMTILYYRSSCEARGPSQKGPNFQMGCMGRISY